MQYEECNGRSAVFSWALKVNARLKMADFLLHSESKWTYLVWTLANQWIHYSRQNPIKEESTEINSGFVQNIFFSLFFIYLSILFFMQIGPNVAYVIENTTPPPSFSKNGAKMVVFLLLLYKLFFILIFSRLFYLFWMYD